MSGERDRTVKCFTFRFRRKKKKKDIKYEKRIEELESQLAEMREKQNADDTRPIIYTKVKSKNTVIGDSSMLLNCKKGSVNVSSEQKKDDAFVASRCEIERLKLEQKEAEEKLEAIKKLADGMLSSTTSDFVHPSVFACDLRILGSLAASDESIFSRTVEIFKQCPKSYIYRNAEDFEDVVHEGGRRVHVKCKGDTALFQILCQSLEMPNSILFTSGQTLTPDHCTRTLFDWARKGDMNTAHDLLRILKELQSKFIQDSIPTAKEDRVQETANDNNSTYSSSSGEVFLQTIKAHIDG